MIRVKLLHEKAKAPTKATPGSAGWDIYAIEDTVIPPGFSEILNTGIAMEIPKGWVGMLSHRSSLAFKLDTIVSMGIIDQDFTGEIKIKLFNLGLEEGLYIKAGDRVAQIVVVPSYAQENIMIVEELSKTERGEGGFGHTGK